MGATTAQSNTSPSGFDRTHDDRPGAALPPLAVGILIALCAAKLLLHIFTDLRHYGYFRDELYYLATSIGDMSTPLRSSPSTPRSRC